VNHVLHGLTQSTNKSYLYNYCVIWDRLAPILICQDSNQEIHVSDLYWFATFHEIFSVLVTSSKQNVGYGHEVETRLYAVPSPLPP
jgi:hypothetical protein